MKLLSFEHRWAEAALAAMFPGDEALIGIAVMNVAAFLADVMARLPARAALGLRVAIWLTALAPIFLLGRPTTFRRLTAAQRERVVSMLVASRWYVLRSLVLMLKMFGALLYASHESVRARMQRPSGRGLISLHPKRLNVA
jgi:hypothetical protein